MTLYAPGGSKVGAKEARDDISMIKFVVANTMQHVVDRALQVHGGLGMTDDTIIRLFLPPRAGGADLRRRRRGAQDVPGQADPEAVRERQVRKAKRGMPFEFRDLQGAVMLSVEEICRELLAKTATASRSRRKTLRSRTW